MRFVIIAALVCFTAGCAHQKPVEEPQPQLAAKGPATAAAPAAPPEVKSCSRDGDCSAAQLCIRGTCVDITAGLAECQTFRVRFGFNATDLDEQARPDLDRMARCLRADQKFQVMIEGNADERGTEEYNLQLGSKRATVVQKYLVTLGVPAAQVNTVSYGENKPICAEQDEACWAKNREASVKPAAGGAAPAKAPAGKKK